MMHKIALLLLLTLPAWAACPASWSDYSYQKTVTIANEQVSGSGSHTSFPVLVIRNDDADLKTVANGGHVEHAGGYDIAFYTPGDALLDYYRVKYTADEGDLVVYVERDVSTSVDTEICLRYGKADASDLSNAVNTFPTLIHYWTMDTVNPVDVIGGLTSTSFGNTATTTGAVNLGLTHDGNGDYSETNGGPNPATLGDFAFSAWASLTATNVARMVVTQRDGTGTGRAPLYYEDITTDKMNSSYGGTATAGGSVISDTNLHFYAAEYDGTYIRVSSDGANEGVAARTIESATGVYLLGRHKTSTTLDWAGIIDEVMFWSEDKGIDWWATMHANGSSPGTFYSVGSEAVPSGGATHPQFRVPAIIGVLFWRAVWMLDYWQ